MSNGRIEIPMDEYKGMKERIESLEKTLVSKDKDIEALQNENLLLQTKLEDVVTMPLFDRLFSWGKLTKEVLKDE